MNDQEKLRTAIDALRRQRTGQQNVIQVLDWLITQAFDLAADTGSPTAHEAAAHIRKRAFELRRIARSVPKFAVDDLIDESIARLEVAHRESAQQGTKRAADT